MALASSSPRSSQYLILGLEYRLRRRVLGRNVQLVHDFFLRPSLPIEVDAAGGDVWVFYRSMMLRKAGFLGVDQHHQVCRRGNCFLELPQKAGEGLSANSRPWVPVEILRQDVLATASPECLDDWPVVAILVQVANVWPVDVGVKADAIVAFPGQRLAVALHQ